MGEGKEGGGKEGRRGKEGKGGGKGRGGEGVVRKGRGEGMGRRGALLACAKGSSLELWLWSIFAIPSTVKIII